jgi:hypothetical protein
MRNRGAYDMAVISLQEDSDILSGRVGHLQMDRLAGPLSENRH